MTQDDEKQDLLLLRSRMLMIDDVWCWRNEVAKEVIYKI